VACGIEEEGTSNSSMVLSTGNWAAFIRARALDSSREAISASSRVRRNSSGDHRWVFAVTISSAARRRIVPSLSLRSPVSRSAARAGAVAAVMAFPP
jgi:hypothetical protein